MCEDFTLNFHDKRTGCCFMTTHRLTLLFSPVNFFFLPKKKMPVPPPPHLFPPTEDTLTGRHFDTNEVIEAESQVVLNAITEHNFQGCI
jgi:hypothetical protein